MHCLQSWYHYYGTGREPKITLNLLSLILILFGLGLAIGVILAVGALLFFQLRSIVRNQTGIEDWIMEKAAYRLRGSDKKFQNPYNIVRLEAHKEQRSGNDSTPPPLFRVAGGTFVR